MLRPFFPEFFMSTDLLSLEHPLVLLFCFSPLPMCHCWWTNCPRVYLSGSNCYGMPKKVVKIVADTSPTLKRCLTAMPPDTGMSDIAGVPRLVLMDVTKLNYVVSDDNTRWYKNADRFIQIKPCEVKIHDIFKDHTFDPNDSKVSKCGSKNWKTCGILITDNSFSSNLTKRSFSTHSFEDLSCKSDNVVYAIECTLCGLIYVGETKGELRKRMNGYRSQINNGGNQLLYRHFNLPDHSVLSMKIRILDKIYHPINKHISSCTSFRRKREEHWIRQLGTAAPYGCNDHIDNIGNLTSPGCQSVNVLNLFDRTSRRHRSHGSRRYNKPEIHDVSFFIMSVRDCTPSLWKPYMSCTNLHWPYILLMLDLRNIDFRVLFWTFPQTGYSKLSGFVILLKQRIGHFWK